VTLSGRTENPGVGGSIPSLLTISLIILSVSCATLTPSIGMSEPADFAVTLPVLSGTTTRMAPRWAWSKASPQHRIVSGKSGMGLDRLRSSPRVGHGMGSVSGPGEHGKEPSAVAHLSGFARAS
jgi:hypothetical protein